MLMCGDAYHLEGPDILQTLRLADDTCNEAGFTLDFDLGNGAGPMQQTASADGFVSRNWLDVEFIRK